MSDKRALEETSEEQNLHTYHISVQWVKTGKLYHIYDSTKHPGKELLEALKRFAYLLEFEETIRQTNSTRIRYLSEDGAD